MRLLIASMMGLAATLPMTASADAAGFATRDLVPFATTVSAALGEGCQTVADPQRVTIVCKSGLGPLVDVTIKRRESNDRIEQNIRSGKTGQPEVDALCKKINDQCTATMLDVAPAVGWIGAQPQGRQALSTAVILRDGDQLTVRALANDPEQARAYVDKTLAVVRPVIGQ
ncbi:hypothetical protein GCM10007301_09060 [Azorhizobium oxalatiphilum]|uniref:Uncharacterized protein n=1 Tax=Azorhizobium oxalatiphilum TaxID=980631 RepID=A0A917BMI0_9HYPH|nr:hypothetical protein [Azorhizobium oxalatiphilum]GGF51808.1 hypothetical protein GCM10007301_09060 [Azorhizobium oxalatiphilum]